MSASRSRVSHLSLSIKQLVILVSEAHPESDPGQARMTQRKGTAKLVIEFGKVYTKNDFEAIVAAARESGAHAVIEKFKDKYEQVLGKTFIRFTL